MILRLDSNGTSDPGTSISVNGSISEREILPIYHADNMEDGDHQLEVFLYISIEYFEIDYFECVVSLLHSVPRTVC